MTSLYLGRTATPMQQRVHEQEGWEYDPSRWIQPETVATSVLQLLDLPSDANIPGLWIRPAASGAPGPSRGDTTWSAHEGRRTGISR